MEKKIKFGCVAWGLPGGGYFAPQIAKEAGLDGIQLELGSYEWGYPLAQKQVQEAYLEERRKQEANWCCIEAGLLVLSLICAVSDSLQIPRLLFMIAATGASGMAFWLNIRFGEGSEENL